MSTCMKAKRYKPHGDYNENIAIMTVEDLKKIENLPDGISDIRYINVDNKKNTMERRQVCAKVVIYEKSLEVPLSENQIYLEGRTLFDHLLINEGDEVYVDALYNEDITYAKEIKIELVNPGEIEGWTEDKIREAKYRIISSEIVLITGNLFWLFASNCKPTLCRVVETVPNELCIKADNQTIIAFVNLPKLASDANITFKDIGGLKEQILKIREMIQLPLEKPEIFKTLGIEPPKGIILYGPPGTGKTLLAKALSNEINANFQSIRGPEVLTKWAGEGEKKLREIFETARQHTPSIIFFDEIDSIAPSRDEAEGMISIRLVSQILDLMDGLVSRGKVFVIAATNRIYAIDPALRRPGRFDREIEIPVPDVDGRKIILSIYLNKMKIDSSIDLEELAKMTSGYTGADIASLCKEAGMKTLRRIVSFDDNGEIIQYDEQLAVNRDDFVEAFKEIVPSTLRTIETEKNDILLNDIVGMEPAKNKISQIFNYAFSDKGAPDRKNSRFILEGPPGSGKSSILNAFANEYSLKIITLTPIDIMQDYYKEIGKVLKNAFMKAIQASPSILLFDHLDSIFSYGEELSKIERFIIDTIIQESQHLRTFKNVVIAATAYNAERIPLLLKSYNGFSILINIQSPDDLERECIIRKIIPSDENKIKGLIKNTQGLFYNEIVNRCYSDNS